MTPPQGPRDDRRQRQVPDDDTILRHLPHYFTKSLKKHTHHAHPSSYPQKVSAMRTHPSGISLCRRPYPARLPRPRMQTLPTAPPPREIAAQQTARTIHRRRPAERTRPQGTASPEPFGLKPADDGRWPLRKGWTRNAPTGHPVLSLASFTTIPHAPTSPCLLPKSSPYFSCSFPASRSAPHRLSCLPKAKSVPQP